MSCEHECEKPPLFPREIYNRPALDTISYRVGMYAEMREYMLDLIDKRPELSGWTHRQADDPGIAILEAGAIVADILTFYQNLYANEAFLRSAKWQESVFDLIRLTGYRPAPGVGGTATFAITAKGDAPVTVPQGFGFKVKLSGSEQQAEFESSEEVVAYPHLGSFALYRPRLTPANITPAATGNQLELTAVDGSTSAADIMAVEINAGDRVMLVPPSAMWDVSGTPYTTQDKPEILVVKQVDRLLDRTLITFEGAITQSRGTSVDAWLIDRTFRHFGHSAPPQTTILTGNPPTASFVPTRFRRQVYTNDVPSSTEINYYSSIQATAMPLDTEVDDLASGGSLICEGTVDFEGQTTPVPLVVVRTIQETRSDSLSWGNMSGPSTVVTVDQRLVPNSSILYEAADIRRLRFHEAVSPRLTMQAPTQWTSGVFPDTRLNFFGTLDQALALKGRSLTFVASDGRFQDVNVQPELPALTAASGTDSRMWEIELDRAPEFIREDFDETNPIITVFGNLVPVTQGKTQPEAPIGSGDNRQRFQSLPLAKSPLTYLLDGAATPPQVPELTVWVDRVEWNRVDTLFGAAADEKVYIVREDQKGASWVQFGDGEMGARLPSGRNNVLAAYRTGVGASGSPEAGAEPKAAGRLTGLDKVLLPTPVVGGAEPESQLTARTAAPGRMQSLGRLVGLADFEAEALTIPDVIKTRALWIAPDGIPRIQIVVLTASGSDADLENVRQVMTTYNRCKGPARYPIEIINGIRQFVHVALTVGYDPARRPEDIIAGIQLALGVSGQDPDSNEQEGLFALTSRRFGETAHKSQILGYTQQVDGVRWVLVDSARLIPLGIPPETDPAQLPIPYPRLVVSTLGCLPNRILALYSAHLELNLVADDRTEACS